MKAIQPRKTSSEVEKFAAWFHQDFGVVGGEDAVAYYVERLGTSQRSTLKEQLEALLQDHPGKDQKGLRNAWYRLGAQWSPRGKDLRPFIERWINALQ